MKNVFLRHIVFVLFALIILHLFRTVTVSAETIDPISEWSLIQTTGYSIPSGGVSVTNNGNIYVLGGSTTDDFDDVAKSTVDSEGLINGWVPVTKLPYTIYQHSFITYKDSIYIIGGLQWPPGFPVNLVSRGTFIENDINNWSSQNNLIKPLGLHASALVNNDIYVTGGYSSTTEDVNQDIYVGTISDNTLNISWRKLSSRMPQGIYGHGLVSLNNYLYIIGGTNPNNGESDLVYKGKILSDGEIESWSQENTLPDKVQTASILRVGEYILIIGGQSNSQAHRNTFYTKINTDGSLEPWKVSASLLPTATCCGSAAILNGYVYQIGGWANGNTTNVLKSKLNISEIPTPSSTPIPSPTPTPLPTPTPTLVPSPTPTPKPADDKLPIILVPGMTACWNYEALVHDINKENKDWTLNPYATVYSNLIGTLNDAGYETGNKLFVYCYDWRKSPPSAIAGLDEIAEAALAKSPSLSTKKVNLIGHSMGGLIVADYANRNENKVNKAIAVGTPFKGSTLAYKVWEGADLSMYQGFEKVAVDLVMQINLAKYSNKANEIRQMVPSLQSVLPIYDYIKIAPNKIRPWNKMTWKNEYLPSLDISAIAPRLTTITGVDKDTEKFILVKPRNGEEARQDEWIDGKPVSVEYGKGDTSVLAESGSIENAANVTIPGAGHQELMYTMAGQQEIIKQLGIPGSARIDSVPQYNNALAITIASPATFQVITPDNTVLSPIDNLLVINDPKNGDYKIKITGLATGDYKIIFGRISENKQSWDEYKGNIRAVGEQTDISFPVDMQAKYLGADPIKKAKDEVTRLIAKIKASHMRKPIINYWVESLESLMRTMDKKPLATQKLVSTIDRLSQGNRWLNWWWWGDREMNKEISDSLALVKSWISQ